ncbi:MAG: DUF6311 domain-containing protein [Candidatus Paceibacterota bacterium]
MSLKILPIYIFIVVGIIIFHYKIGIWNVLPFNVDWLLQASDWPQHHLGWEFFRRAPWNWPLGDFSNLLYPVTTNIGFTDSIPLLAISFKLLNLILPNFFQYIGLWLLFNLIMQGYLAFLIFKKLNLPTNYSILAGVFLQLTPALIARFNHPALTAHWLILLTIYNYLSFKGNSRDIYLNFLAIVLSSLIHPYLAIMIIPLSLANLWRFQSWPKVILLSISAIIIPYILWLSIGYFVEYSIGDPQSLGYYSASLQTFFNPAYAIWDHHIRDASFWLNVRSPRYMLQYEGFAYMGIGLLIAIVINTITLIIKLIKKPNKIIIHIIDTIKSFLITKKIFFVITIFWISLYAIMHHDIVINIEAYSNFYLVDLFLEKAGVIRANGRFIWPLMYVIIIFIIYLLYRLLPKKAYYIVLILLTAQAIDISPLIKERLFKNQELTTVNSDEGVFWRDLIKNYDAVYMYPGGQRTYNRNDDYIIFTFWAAQNNIPINAGYLSRYDFETSRKFNLELEQNLNTKKLDKNILYITNKEYRDLFQDIGQSTGRELVEFDNYYILK